MSMTFTERHPYEVYTDDGDLIGRFTNWRLAVVVALERGKGTAFVEYEGAKVKAAKHIAAQREFPLLMPTGLQQA